MVLIRSVHQGIMLTNVLSTYPKIWELYQGRIDSCEVAFPSDGGRACRTRFKFIIWPCLFKVSRTLFPIGGPWFVMFLKMTIFRTKVAVTYLTKNGIILGLLSASSTG
jgi:hypothetical protein